MSASPELIKKLRDMTQAGVMDCKKALDETNNDIDAAVQWLREKGIAKAAKKADAIASEGVALVGELDNKAIIIEVNAQTDFVAKNDEFLKLASAIKSTLLKSDLNDNDIESAKKLKLENGKTIEEACVELTSKIGEKISLRRFQIINKKSDESFAIYEHSNKRVATLILLKNNPSEEVKKNVAMHAAAMAPKFVNSSKVDSKWLENEKKVLTEQTIAEGKPKEFADKIVKGRINKLLSEVCLDDQAYVKDPSITVAQYLKNNNSLSIDMVRYEVGEGIEKKECNFADEVAAQMK